MIPSKKNCSLCSPLESKIQKKRELKKNQTTQHKKPTTNHNPTPYIEQPKLKAQPWKKLLPCGKNMWPLVRAQDYESRLLTQFNFSSDSVEELRQATEDNLKRHSQLRNKIPQL